MADYIIPVITILGTIIVTSLGIIPAMRQLHDARKQWQAQEDKRSTERLKALSEKDRLEQEITELVLAQAKRQLDAMQAEITQLRCEAQQREEYHNRRYSELEKIYTGEIRKLKNENENLRDRVRELEKKTGAPK